MKASKFTDALKAFVVKQGEEGTPVAKIMKTKIRQIRFLPYTVPDMRQCLGIA